MLFLSKLATRYFVKCDKLIMPQQKRFSQRNIMWSAVPL